MTWTVKNPKGCRNCGEFIAGKELEKLGVHVTPGCGQCKSGPSWKIMESNQSCRKWHHRS